MAPEDRDEEETEAPTSEQDPTAGPDVGAEDEHAEEAVDDDDAGDDDDGEADVDGSSESDDADGDDAGDEPPASAETAPAVVPATAKPKSGASIGILVHIALLVGAVIFALVMWTGKDDRAVALGDVTIWDGDSDSVTKIVFELAKKRVELTAQDDAQGRWFTGKADKPVAPDNPHAPPPEDGKEAAPGEMVAVEFVSVAGANTIAEQMAPMRALRALGVVGADRQGEFGLEEPQGKLVVTMGNVEHVLELGDRAPGARDFYARLVSSGEVYVLKGDALRDLEGTDQKLMERDLHDWNDRELATATIKVGDRTRTLTRSGAEGERFWATSDAPDTKDETLDNWMASLDRLKPSRYEAPPANAEPVLQVEYAGSLGAMGFVQLTRAPADKEGAFDYWIVTEHTRKPAKIAGAAADALARDLDSVLP